MFLLEHWLKIFTSSIFLLFFLIFYCKWTYQYWKRKNLNHLKSSPPFGHYPNLLENGENLGLRVKRIYDKMKSKGWKHGGVYFLLSPTYVVVDLEYVKNILTKDFDHFVNRGFFYNKSGDPLSAHLFNIGGKSWRNLRTKLTPTFTSGKMKLMFQTLLDCVPNLIKTIEAQNGTIDMKEVSGCFTTNVIGCCAFGLDFNTFADKDSPFRKYGQRSVVLTTKQIIKLVFSIFAPNLSRKLQVAITDRKVTKFFLKLVKDTVKYREEEKIDRNDFIKILLDMKNKNREDPLTLKEMAAQCYVFFIAGYETSSSTMTFTLFELSKNIDIQEKLRQEIDTVLKKFDKKITYEAINEMKYLDQVVNETLRMYPPVNFITRKCVKDYKIPGEDIVIEKDTMVVIPIQGIHYDQDYYPDPFTFDPDRFTEENKNKRPRYSHVPFGEGPRICIGMRFGMMQTKVGLASLLMNYRFSLNQKTSEPLKISNKSFLMCVEGGVWLDAEKVN